MGYEVDYEQYEEGMCKESILSTYTVLY